MANFAVVEQGVLMPVSQLVAAAPVQPAPVPQLVPVPVPVVPVPVVPAPPVYVPKQDRN